MVTQTIGERLMTNTVKRGLAALTVVLTLGSGTAVAELQPWRD